MLNIQQGTQCCLMSLACTYSSGVRTQNDESSTPQKRNLKFGQQPHPPRQQFTHVVSKLGQTGPNHACCSCVPRARTSPKLALETQRNEIMTDNHTACLKAPPLFSPACAAKPLLLPPPKHADAAVIASKAAPAIDITCSSRPPAHLAACSQHPASTHLAARSRHQTHSLLPAAHRAQRP